MKTNLFDSRIGLVLIGIALGLLARMVLGVPETDPVPPMTIDRELTAEVHTSIDVPLENRDPKEIPEPRKKSALIPPFDGRPIGSHLGASIEDFAHDSTALFEPHGEQICASGCAASRHPTKELTRSHYTRLLSELILEPMDRTNNALEELLYFGPQTRKFIETIGTGKLERSRSNFLWEQLQTTHAKISIRVVDEEGETRTWLEPTRVPFDRRHVFDMKTSNLQSLVTSGTVKRVGLDHLWVRL